MIFTVEDAPIISATIPSPLMPIDRIRVFDDPLDLALANQGLGRVMGAKTHLNGDADIVEFVLSFYAIQVDPAICLAKAVLETQGAPVGSKLSYELDGGSHELSLGRSSGLVLALDGETLPTEVYENFSLDDIYDGLTELLGNLGDVQGDRNRNGKVEIYIFGQNHAIIEAAIRPFIAAHPLCQKSELSHFSPHGPITTVTGGALLNRPQLPVP